MWLLVVLFFFPLLVLPSAGFLGLFVVVLVGVLVCFFPPTSGLMLNPLYPLSWINHRVVLYTHRRTPSVGGRPLNLIDPFDP